jgi:hypothetical protein
MQKVEGSSPFIRFTKKACNRWPFVFPTRAKMQLCHEFLLAEMRYGVAAAGPGGGRGGGGLASGVDSVEAYQSRQISL